MNYKVTKETLCTLDTLGNWWSVVLFVIGILIIVAFLYIDRGQAVSNIILSAGWLGIVTAIFLITLFSMTPIPTESLTIMCLKSYGIGWGIFYSWVGSTLSSVAIFLLVRSIREPILQLVISQERFAAPVHHPKAPQISTKITHHPTKSHVSKKSVHKTVKTIKSVKTAKLAKTKPKAKQSTVHA
ncbi:TVP38/TMEM64 family protein [Desulfosporosinus metallidurans]|uniref:TVP38/TMEM64 family protein n=1 Tax=Desulfosporosinus metallidurans TaxID=1888891 RepID=UPI00094D64E7|nr:hypothetical protein [Desulfosporosinus metallidurans]